MNTKRWFAASLAAFLVIFAVEFVQHGVLLQDLYRETAALWRPDEEIRRLVWLAWLGYAVFALVFAWLYARGYEEGRSGLAQGLRYGVGIGLLLGVPNGLGGYAAMPIPPALAAAWFFAAFLEGLLAGVAVGLIYRR